ncbi:class I SAM-dependent rRNA methyltransferase [candidate division KSB1 bacterium]|nr:class I SAM-dependent rRNA methyltransferase [candidate division KSB1 bacterium]
MHPSYPILTLKRNREYAILKGHPWIFSGAIANLDVDIQPGTVVQVRSYDNQDLGLGFFNSKSDITIRMISRTCDQPVNQNFWRNPIQSAVQMRKRVVSSDTNAFRLINAEGDGMPGLIVDQYHDSLAISFQTAGMESFRDMILDILIEVVSPSAIYERSDSRSRRREGLQDRSGWLKEPQSIDPLIILENGLKFEVDIVSGQKTGFFLDQRPNRQICREVSQGLRVLNCFSYTGGFSIYGAAGGANQVVSLESSKTANETAVRNLESNGFSSNIHPVITGDVFDYLKNAEETFDLIILDPPAFAKSHRDVQRASRGYNEINRQAMLRLQSGGLLMTFSCSNPLSDEMFHKIILNAAADAGKSVQLLQPLGPGPDHPVLLAHSEGHYLKGLLLRII